MSEFVARLTMDDGSVVVWEPADPAVISVAEEVDAGEHIGSLVAVVPGKTYPKRLVVDNVKSVRYAPGVYRDPAEASAHARGVAEERARWSVEALAKALHSMSHHHRGGADEALARAGCVQFGWDVSSCVIKARAILAAMAPSSPQDGPSAPEGDGTA